jgi:hypothetical protein
MSDNLLFMQVRRQLDEVGIRIGKTPHEEFRVTPKGYSRRDAEAQAYYTSDLQDALDTGLKMSKDQGQWI